MNDLSEATHLHRSGPCTNILRNIGRKPVRMPPFTIPKIVLAGLKEKVDSLTVQGRDENAYGCRYELIVIIIADRLYLGSSTGALNVYSLSQDPVPLSESCD